MIACGCYLRKSKNRSCYCSQVGLNLTVLAASLALIAVRSRLRRFGKSFHVICFISLFHLFYTLAFAWYMPIIGYEPRTILSLMIPFLWTVGLAVHAESLSSWRIRILNSRISASTVVYSAMLLSLIYEIHQVIAYRVYTMYRGE